MKKIFLFFLALPALGYVNAQDQAPYMSKPLPGSVNNVVSETTGGNITVIAVAPSEARVEVYIRPSNQRNSSLSKEEIQQKLDEQFNLKVEVSGNTVTAIARRKIKIIDWNKTLNISFNIYVPSATATKLSTSGGNIKLEGLSGKQDFSTSGGNLEIHHVKGPVGGRTSGGNVDVSDSENDIDLATSGGNIKATRCNGAVKLTTSGGSVHLTELLGKIEATTSGGNVEGRTVAGELDAHTSGGNVVLADISASLTASTSGGNLNVVMSGLGKYVRLANSGGNIDLEIPSGRGLDLDISGDRVRSGPLSNFTGKMEKDAINGKVNGGGIPVRINGGNVHLTLK